MSNLTHLHPTASGPRHASACARNLSRENSDPWPIIRGLECQACQSLCDLAHHKKGRLGALILGAWLLVCLAIGRFPSEHYHTPLNTLTSAYNLNFAWGMLAFWAGTKSKKFAQSPRNAITAISLLTGIALLWMGAQLDFNDSRIAGYLYGPGFAIMVFGLIELERSGNWPKIPAIVFIGNASYSMYLVHETCMTVTFRICEKIGLTSPIIVFLCAGAAAIAGGCIAYAFFEKPLLKILKGMFVKPPVQQINA